MVTGAPSADRRQKYKPHVLIGAGVFALIVLVVLLINVLPSGSDSRPATGATVRDTSPAIPAENLLRLIAIDNVRVKVTQQSDGKILFDGDLIKGDSRALERNGKVYVTYDIGKNLQVEIRGQRFRMSIDGYGRNTLE